MVETRDFARRAAGVPAPREGRALVVAPMVAGGPLDRRRHRRPRGRRAPLTDAERHPLWTLGKVAALAPRARIATRQRERARAARGAHRPGARHARRRDPAAVRRVAGARRRRDARRRVARGAAARRSRPRWASCARRVQRPLRRAPRPTGTTLADELARLRRRAPGTRHRARGRRSGDVPAAARAARPVGARRGDAQRPQARRTRARRGPRRARGRRVRARGRQRRRRASGAAAPSGMGLRLAAFEALQHGGVVEFGRSGPDDAGRCASWSRWR